MNIRQISFTLFFVALSTIAFAGDDEKKPAPRCEILAQNNGPYMIVTLDTKGVAHFGGAGGYSKSEEAQIEIDHMMARGECQKRDTIQAIDECEVYFKNPGRAEIHIGNFDGKGKVHRTYSSIVSAMDEIAKLTKAGKCMRVRGPYCQLARRGDTGPYYLETGTGLAFETDNLALAQSHFKKFIETRFCGEVSMKLDYSESSRFASPFKADLEANPTAKETDDEPAKASK